MALCIKTYMCFCVLNDKVGNLQATLLWLPWLPQLKVKDQIPAKTSELLCCAHISELVLTSYHLSDLYVYSNVTDQLCYLQKQLKHSKFLL